MGLNRKKNRFASGNGENGHCRDGGGCGCNGNNQWQWFGRWGKEVEATVESVMIVEVIGGGNGSPYNGRGGGGGHHDSSKS